MLILHKYLLHLGWEVYGERCSQHFGYSLKTAKYLYSGIVISMTILPTSHCLFLWGMETKQGHFWLELPPIRVITCIGRLPPLPNFNFLGTQYFSRMSFSAEGNCKAQALPITSCSARTLGAAPVLRDTLNSEKRRWQLRFQRV